MIGQTLGSYTIERELGRGGMGAVYAAVHALLGRRAAVKVLLPELSRDQDIVQRFFNEARAATAIKHPSIVEIYDFGWGPDGSAFIVMELMDGESLASRLRRIGRLPPPAAATIARQAANALAAAHRAGIVHRDLKPDNVFLVPDVEVAGGERVKLLDFGIAKLAADGGVSRTTTGAIMGTPLYMSPEQCEGARLVDHRSDLYSLGCMLFEMVTGRVPFVNQGVGGLIGMHLHVAPPALRSLAPDAPVELEAVVAKLLAKAPGDRYQSADEVAAALARCGAVSSIGAAVPSIPPGQSLPASSLPASSLPASSLPASSLPASSLPPPAMGFDTAATQVPRPTTLSAAAGASASRLARSSSRRGLWLALGGLALVAGAVVAVVAVIAASGSKSSVPAAGTGSASIAADAAGLAAVDAVPAPPDPLLAAAQTSLDERRWTSALALAEDILDQEPQNPTAVAIRDQATRGQKAATAVAGMKAALAARDWTTLRDDLDVVYDHTADGDPYRATADAVVAEARPKAIADGKKSVDKLVRAGECSAARKKAADTAAAWGDDALPLIKTAAGCQEASVGGDPVAADAGVAPGDGVAKLLADTEQAVQEGHYGAALALCKKAGLGSTDQRLATACLIAACHTGNRKTVLRYATRLTGTRRNQIAQVCARAGITLDAPDEPAPNGPAPVEPAPDEPAPTPAY